MMDLGQRVGGRPRSFEEQDRIMADFNWTDLDHLHAHIVKSVPEWSEQSTRTMVYGYMLVHGCTSSQAAERLLEDGVRS